MEADDLVVYCVIIHPRDHLVDACEFYRIMLFLQKEQWFHMVFVCVTIIFGSID